MADAAKPSLCICVSGQLRGNLAGLARMRDDLVDDFDITVVISTWDKWGKKKDGALTRPQLSRMLGEDVAFVIPERWNSELIYHKIAGLREFVSGDDDRDVTREEIRQALGPETVIDIEAPIMDLSHPHKGDGNVLRQNYKGWRANRIKKQLEIDAGKPFDFVIKARPDVLVRDIAQFRNRLGAGQLGVLSPDPAWVNDVLFVGDSASVDKACDFFLHVLSAGQTHWRGVHVELGAFLKDADVPLIDLMMRCDFIGDVAMRPEAICQGLMHTAQHTGDPVERLELRQTADAVRLINAAPASPDALAALASPILDGDIIAENEGFLTLLARKYLDFDLVSEALLAGCLASCGSLFWSRSMAHVPVREVIRQSLRRLGLEDLPPDLQQQVSRTNPALAGYAERYQRVNGAYAVHVPLFVRGTEEQWNAFVAVSSATWGQPREAAMALAEQHRPLLQDFHRFWFMRHLVNQRWQQTEAALEELQQALERVPDRLEYRVRAGRALLELGRMDEARAMLEPVAAAWPTHEVMAELSSKLATTH